MNLALFKREFFIQYRALFLATIIRLLKKYRIHETSFPLRFKTFKYKGQLIFGAFRPKNGISVVF